MTASTSAFRARFAAAAVAFAVVSGGALATAAPAFATTTPVETTPEETTTSVEPSDDTTTEPAATTEAPATEPSATVNANVILPNERLGYQLAGFTPGATVEVVINGPASGSIQATIGEDGTYAGEISYVEIDTDGNESDIDFPVGSYTVDVYEAEGDLRAAFTFEVVTAMPEPTATEEAPADPVASATQDTFLPSDVVTYTGANFTPDATFTAQVDGPVSGTLEGTVGEDGTIGGEITYNEYDGETNELIQRIDFPVGEYTVTITDTEGLTATFTFTIAGPVAETTVTPTPGTVVDSSDQLATTGGEDVFGIAGLGLLVAGAGVATLALRRRLASK